VVISRELRNFAEVFKGVFKKNAFCVLKRIPLPLASPLIRETFLKEIFF